MPLELWTRPWAFSLNPPPGHRRNLEGAVEPPAGHRGALWLYNPDAKPIPVDGRAGYAAEVAGFRSACGWLGLLPLPTSQAPLRLPNGATLSQPEAPAKWQRGAKAEIEREKEAEALAQRVANVWDRLQDMEVALAAPARLWEELRQRWMTDSTRPPHMRLIVKQAQELAPVIDALERAPRRVLRRTHQLVPVARAREMDRRAMLWAARRPGETLAERAGNDQRLLATTREESVDTLENRVLRSYAELAAVHARDYLAAHRGKALSDRAFRVRGFERRCRHLARDLIEQGVGVAEADVTPNFTLLEDARYRKVWLGWRDLLANDRTEDELWRWQARSWEEFCALATVIAILDRSDARLVGAEPVHFREDQERGSWIRGGKPIASIWLKGPGAVVDVAFREAAPDEWRGALAAPIWVRRSPVDGQGAPDSIAVWPLWHKADDQAQGEAEEVDAVVKACRARGGPPATLAGGIVLQPSNRGYFHIADGLRGAVVELGVVGGALSAGLIALKMLLDETLGGEGPR
ncbi:DUF2357 domain-containing protein [Zavarzinia sp. CC-PAN008]|uniref:DUF2357 domain-containing protein n=1 Tax=Zavarzinia sp. CC-PAN008 TaxID=3243332 RepID=UPI003F745DDE